jgi:predicted DNA repair protein MutK
MTQVFLNEKSKNKGFLFKFGEILVKALPIVIKILGVVGTIALILVSGGIFLHNIDYIHHIIPHNIPSTIVEFGLGIVFGLVAVFIDDHF